ncbi:META domain-containing protein [Helicobacter burdigaliensis]|uniref:META domain-containing protein n=1 Tax=Helicobacter burdigaliensis TaxID=2315334 RepID=UPI000EF6BE1B|nr:META domain-containing protein [Helicobacter burdigaliensis]
MQKKILAGILGMGLVFSACSSKSGVAQNYNFEEILSQKEQWSITKYTKNGVDNILSIKEGEKKFFLGFKEGKMFGYAGCNNFFGGYSIEGNTLSIGNGGMTRMMCDPDSMEIEADISSALFNQKSKLVKNEDGSLDIISKDVKLNIK